MSSTVSQIKNRLGTVEVVSAYLKLEPAGRNWKARCPFHNEKTPSFFVSPERESYHCFGCNRGGDIFSFVEEMEGVDFLGALKILAERAGVPLTAAPVKDQQGEVRLHEALAAAAAFYQGELAKTPAAQRYLKERGVSDESVKTFALGFAPSVWQTLYRYLRARGFSDTELLDAGLVARAEQGEGIRYYDRFRGRIMFPFFDSAGRVVGFSGRLLPTAGSSDPNTAKYINSPQTAVYDKSRFLYGYRQAKLEIRRQNFTVLVEGQLDLVLSHQTGVTNAVAVSGTALTNKHLDLLRRLSPNVVMSFDGDQAGLAASRRAIELALELGLEVKIAELPLGRDPADLARENPVAWHGVVTEAQQAIDFFLAALIRRGLDRRALAHAIKTEVYPLVLKLTQRLDRAHFVRAIAELTGLAEEVINADLNDMTKATPLTLLTTNPSPSPAVATRRDQLLDHLFGLWWWKDLSIHPRLLEVLGEDSFKQAETDLGPRRSELVWRVEISYADFTAERLQTEVADLLSQLHREELKRQLSSALGRLSEAERAGQTELVAKYLSECQDISRQLN